MRFAPVFKYRMRDCAISMLMIIAVMIALTLLVQVGVLAFGQFTPEDGFEETTSTMNFTMPYAIFMFIFGIISIREDLRLGIQNGASRGTSFLANLSCIAATSLLLALSGVAFYLVWNALDTGVILIDFYSMMYLGNFTPTELGDIFMSAVMTFVMSMSLAGVGCFISLMYWRLSKLGKWIVTLGFGAVLVLVVNAGVRLGWLGKAVGSFARFVVEDPWNLNIVFIAVAVAFYAFARLLVRRNAITAATA